jgi:hypothetical protein
MDAALIKTARDEASKLVRDTLASLAQAGAPNGAVAKDSTEPRLFFPTGIELLYFKLAFGKEIDITISIAGEKAKYPGTSGAAVLVETGDANAMEAVADEG